MKLSIAKFRIKCVCLSPVVLGTLSLLPCALRADTPADSTTNGAVDTVKVASDTASSTALPPAPAPPEAANPASPKLSLFSFGSELFFGSTNATGVMRRSNDGLWAGQGTALPSNLSLNWHSSNNSRAFRVAVGIGDMYTASGTTLRQPIEGFYQMPLRGQSLTVGKFYVPFATQEYEYESKWGAMLSGSLGRGGYAASLNYNDQSRTANAYARIGRQWATGTTLGLSASLGRGVFFGSSHNGALGVDVTQEFKAVRFNSEYNLAWGPKGVFQFAFAKLTLTRLGKLEPYVGAYYLGDGGGELGSFRSVLIGLNYHFTKALAMEGGYARANGRNVLWLQTHLSL